MQLHANKTFEWFDSLSYKQYFLDKYSPSFFWHVASQNGKNQFYIEILDIGCWWEKSCVELGQIQIWF